MRLRLKYVVEDRDRHGNPRLYVRLPGRAKVRIRAIPGTAEFYEAYKDAIANNVPAPHYSHAKPGSFRWLSQLFYASTEFTGKDLSTQKWHRRALDSISQKHGDKPIKLMEPRHVRMIRDERKDKPAAANHRLKALRKLFGWAIEEQHAPHDPTLGVKGIRYVTKGHHTWSPEEVKQFEARHPLGSKARLAKDLLQYTTGRREDAPRLGPQHVRDGRISFTQAKNEHRDPVYVDMPLHPKLAASITAYAKARKVRHHLTFLVTEFGKPFTANGFGNWFRDRCNEAGLPQCSAHGLRKATATRLAEGRASPHEIMAITGHRTLEQVERYTRAASRSKLADSAMRKLK
jgi:integrase/recombinase XerD